MMIKTNFSFILRFVRALFFRYSTGCEELFWLLNRSVTIVKIGEDKDERIYK